MKQKRGLSLLITALFVIAFMISSAMEGGSAQEAKPSFKNNSCVECHSQLLEPLSVSNRYLEWQLSAHEAKGVSCDKCHGGEPAQKEKEKAHKGVLRPSNLDSRLHWKKQPETCNSCHQNVVDAFVNSVHYQRLKGVGLGPSCNTCHSHMATKVIYSPDETGSLCAVCHDSINFIEPRPEIPIRAKDTMTALQRASSAISWSELLLAEGQKRNWQLSVERNELKLADDALTDAKIKWHAFNLEDVRKQADAAYGRSSKVKDTLRRRLGLD